MSTLNPSSSPFERHVVDSLARLETTMHSLVGNGQPGRIGLLEDKVNRVIYIGIAVAVIVLGPAAIHFFF